MKPFLHGERNYAFGQTMLTLWTNLGMTQAELAEHLGVSRGKRWGTGRQAAVIQTLTISKPSLPCLCGSRSFPLERRSRKSERCGKRHTRRCCSMSPGFRLC